MKMKTNLLAFLLLLLAMCLNTSAQVGINKDTPDPSSILHVDDQTRGVLFPRIPYDNSMTPTPHAEGLLYYNTTEHGFRYYNGSEWSCISPWDAADKTAISTSGTVTLNNTLTANGAVTVNNTLTANSFSGPGTIPIGGIIMWSGTTAPIGWALCNGDNGTPDLRGRFIVGYIDDDTQGHTNDLAYATKMNDAIQPDYKTIGNPAGSANVVLNANQLPTHSHEIIDYGHGHSITGTVMQKEGSSTQTVVALDVGNDAGHGNVTFNNKIGSSKTNVTVRNTGGTYTYTALNNPPQYDPNCTIWEFNCTLSNGMTFNTNVNLTAGNYFFSSNYVALYFADDYGYQICTPPNGGYCGLGYTDTYLGAAYTVTGCAANSGYNSSNPKCLSANYDPNAPVGAPIRINEKWTVLPVDKRPPYYVLAFIMRIK